MKQEQQWSYKRAYDESLKELQEKAASEYRKLKKDTAKADALIKEADEQLFIKGKRK